MLKVMFLAMASMILVLQTPALAAKEAAAANEPTAEQAAEDAAEIHALYDAHGAKFEGIYGGVSVSETSVEASLKLCETQLAKIEMLEAEVLPEMEPVLARIVETWGPEREFDPEADAAEVAMSIGGDIEWNIKMAASGNDPGAARDLPEQFDDLSTRYIDLVRMLTNVQKTREADAQYLVDLVQNVYSPDIIAAAEDGVPRLIEARTLLEHAVRFDKNNAYANDRMATIDAEIDALAKAVEAEIDARTWAGDAAGAPVHAGAGLQFLRNHPNWGKNENATEVLDVCVTGGWVPGERDIFGRIISWGLPVHVAIAKPAYQELNRARVYELTLITGQGAPGRVAKAPPFAKYWVGDSWFIRPGNVPR